MASNSPEEGSSPLSFLIRARQVTCLAVVVLAGAAAAATGHGILQGSSPRANAVLPSSPPEVVLAFNEPIDETFSRVEILNHDGSIIAGSAQVSAGGRRMRVTLSPLLPGVYTVRWRVLSAVDGHVTSGAFLFAVGEGRQIEATPRTGERPGPLLVAARWLTLLAGLSLSGVVAYQATILDPVLRRLSPEHALVVREALPRLRRLRVVASAIFLTALAWEFIAHAGALLGGDPGTILRRAVLVPLIIETRGGWSLLVRGFMAALLLMPDAAAWRILRAAGLVWFVVLTAVIVFLGGPAAVQGSHVTVIVLVAAVYGLASVMAAIIMPGIRDVRIPEGRWVRPAAAGVLLWGFTLGSHAASGGISASIIDWLHLAAAAVWVGGLPALLLTFRSVPRNERTLLARPLVPRVSQVAGVALLIMIVTGTAAAWRNVGTLRGLVESFYGQVLLTKLAFVLLIAAMGALNRFVFRPRIASGQNGRALTRFRLSVGVEVGLAAAILLAVAVLTITPPAAVTQPSREARAVVLGGIADELRVRLSISPAAPGWNDVEATVTRVEDGRPVTDAAVQVVLRAMDHIENRAFGLAPSAGTYVASGDFLAPGWWEVTVRIQREGRTRETRFPLIAGQVPRVAQPQAEALLERVRRQMRGYQSWREVEQISDGRGNAVLTRFEAVRPDRLRYRTSGGSEVVIVGAVRYARERGGEWVRDQLPQPLALDGPLVSYMNGAERVRFGREDVCDTEPCRVVL
ncbi:MAG TPA: copper resistance protein CopC, partial [bacterium]|nr:copper resistance protein CopC [bacterium]